MKNSTKTILHELTQGFNQHNRHVLIESRGHHVITAAVHLLESIQAEFGSEVAQDLERRLISSVRARDPERFARQVRRLK